ncbi:MAG TPA: M42 family metallopeptidase [candidate division Zixibacteria bacterium]|nr:M42 family metallopeptidase [candidate division Zixibacteria bacterium]
MKKLDATEQLLQELTNANGVPGYEDDARAVMKKHIAPLADTVTCDRLGSLIATKKGKSADPKVLIGGHLDEVGFMVKEITKEGYIKFLPLGGWWGHVALAQRMRIVTDKGPVLGVVGSQPPHLLEPEQRKKVVEIKEMFIDVGVMEKFDVEKKLGIKVGDPIVPESDFTVMGNQDVYMAKAFDNRCSCGLVVEAFRALKRAAHPNTLIGVGSVQEEVGLRGATTMANATQPDVAIIMDTGIAQDIPPAGFGKTEKLGGGPAILIYDASMIPNTRLRDLVIDTARKKKIPFHLTGMERGGTDGGRVHISGSGVPSIVIGPPVRYIHSHNSIMARKDYDNTIKLVTEVIKRLDKKTVNSLYPKA